MLDFSFPVMAAWTNAAIFAAAGLINFTAVKSVRAVYGRWDVSPGFYRPLGLVEIAAAVCLAVPSLRFWGVLLAMPIFFGLRSRITAASIGLISPGGPGSTTMCRPS